MFPLIFPFQECEAAKSAVAAALIHVAGAMAAMADGSWHG